MKRGHATETTQIRNNNVNFLLQSISKHFAMVCPTSHAPVLPQVCSSVLRLCAGRSFGVFWKPFVTENPNESSLHVRACEVATVTARAVSVV